MKKMQWGEDPDFSGPMAWFRESLIIHEITKIKSAGRVFDFGCGSGRLLTRLSIIGFSGLGIDASKKAIDFFQKKIKEKQSSEKLQAVVGNEKVLFTTKHKSVFDIVIAGEVLEHVRNDKKAVMGFYNVLKDKGICVVTVPAHQSYWDKTDDFASHYRRYEKEDLEKIFTAAGFKIKKVYYWGYPLGLFWHKTLLLPLIEKKIKTGIKYSDPRRLFGRLLANSFIKKICASPFWIDQLFNWTRKGLGLLLVAEK